MSKRTEEQKQLTQTQLEYLDVLKIHGFILVTEGPSYATFKLHKRQMHSSSFYALQQHGMIELISKHKSYPLITSVYKITKRGLK